MAPLNRPKVGIGCFILNEKNQFLMGRRIGGGNGHDTYALPGGHLEFGETFEQCSSREVQEETGLSIEPTEFEYTTTTNNILHKEGKHYVTVFTRAWKKVDEEPRNLEEDKCAGWEWVDWGDYIKWAEVQVELEKGVERSTDIESRLLFRPMINLLEQRPDIKSKVIPSSA